MNCYSLITNAFTKYSIFNLIFWLSGSFMFLFEIFGFLTPYNKQKTNKIAIYKKIIPIVTRNTFIYTIPAFLAFAVYEHYYENTNNTLFDVILEIGIGRILMEILFYSIHRLLHTRKAFILIHKIHHEITSPVSIAAGYMSGIDLYLGISFLFIYHLYY